MTDTAKERLVWRMDAEDEGIARAAHTIIPLCDEVDQLRREVAQLDAISRSNREHVTTVVDEEFGFRVGGMGCEHPSLTGDRCDACGWTEEWEPGL